MVAEDSVTEDASGQRMAGLGKWLARGIGIVTAATAAVGIGSGDLERVLRNEAPQALLYLMLVAIGIGSGVIVSQTAGATASGDPEKKVGGVALAGIVIGGLVLAVALFWPSRVAVSGARWWMLALAALLLVTSGVLVANASRSRSKRESAEASAKRTKRLTYAAVATGALSFGILLVALYVATPRVGAVILGVVVTVVALAWVRWPPTFTISALLVSIGFVAFFVGLSGFFALAVDNTSAKDRPTINASLSLGESGGLSLEVGVVASGLRTDEHVLVTIEGLHSNVSLSDVRAGRGESSHRLTSFGDSAQPLHLSRTGPDPEGAVDLHMVVPVSPGLYERLRVNAFLVSAGADDVLGQIEQLDRRVAQDQADRVEYDQSNNIGAIPDDLINARSDIDALHLKGDLDDDHYGRLLVERSLKDSELYDEQLGEVLLEERNAFDQEVLAERNRLLEVLEREIVQDVRCAVGAQARGCVIILIPETPVLPLIKATLTSGDDGWSADVAVEMASLSAQDIVILTVSTRRALDESFEPKYVARYPPDRFGALATSVVLPLAPDVVQVCVSGEASLRSEAASSRSSEAQECDPTSEDIAVVVFSVPSDATGTATTEPSTSTTSP